MASDLTVHGSEYAHLCNDLHAENERLKAERDAALRRAVEAEAAGENAMDEAHQQRQAHDAAVKRAEAAEGAVTRCREVMQRMHRLRDAETQDELRALYNAWLDVRDIANGHDPLVPATPPAAAQKEGQS